MAVEGPSKADISCHDNKDGTVAVTYLPTAPGEYKISVMFSDKHIKGSPFSAKITGNYFKTSKSIPFIPVSNFTVVSAILIVRNEKKRLSYHVILLFAIKPSFHYLEL